MWPRKGTGSRRLVFGSQRSFSACLLPFIAALQGIDETEKGSTFRFLAHFCRPVPVRRLDGLMRLHRPHASAVAGYPEGSPNLVERRWGRISCGPWPERSAAGADAARLLERTHWHQLDGLRNQAILGPLAAVDVDQHAGTVDI